MTRIRHFNVSAWIPGLLAVAGRAALVENDLPTAIDIAARYGKMG